MSEAPSIEKRTVLTVMAKEVIDGEPRITAQIETISCPQIDKARTKQLLLDNIDLMTELTHEGGYLLLLDGKPLSIKPRGEKPCSH